MSTIVESHFSRWYPPPMKKPAKPDDAGTWIFNDIPRDLMRRANREKPFRENHSDKL